MFEQRLSFGFEAAHELGGNVDESDHIYSRIHGHSFEVTLILRGESLSPKGWLTDFAKVRAVAAEIHGKLDHSFLNGIEGLKVPTLENLSKYIFDACTKELPQLKAVEVARPSLKEAVRYEA